MAANDIRQYVGARYVFKIYENSQDPSSAEWESGVTYEPLTIVTYLNSSYASKKDVPGSVGNPAANPQYWIVTGAYNGQIASLQQQIDTINNTTIPNIEAAIQTLTDKNQLSKKKYVLVGDSYAASYDTLGCSWLRDFVNNYDIPAANYYDATYSGTGFTTTRTFKNNIENIINTISNTDDITDIVVLGGINDVLYGTLSNLGSAINDFCTYCKTNFANASIHLGFVGNIINSNTEGMFNAINTFIDYSKTNGIHYLHNIEFVLRNKRYMNLTHLVGGLAFHPNQYGTTMIAGHLAECLLSGYADVRYRGTNQLNVNYTLISTIDNNDVKLWYGGHLFSGLDDTLASNAALTIDTFRTGAILDGCNEGETKVLTATVQCLVSYDQNNTGTNEQVYVPLNIVFENGRMDLYLAIATTSMNHVKAISIPRFTLSWVTTSI